MAQEIVKYSGEFSTLSVSHHVSSVSAGRWSAPPVEGGVRGPAGPPENVIGPSYRALILFNSQPYILPLLKNGFKGFHPIALASSGAAHSGYPYSARGVTTTGDMAYTGRGKS